MRTKKEVISANFGGHNEVIKKQAAYAVFAAVTPHQGKPFQLPPKGFSLLLKAQTVNFSISNKAGCSAPVRAILCDLSKLRL